MALELLLPVTVNNLGNLAVTAASSTSDDGKNVSVTAGGSTADNASGGDLTITAGSSTGADSTSGTLELAGGYGVPAVGSDFVEAGDLVLRPGRGRDADGTTCGAIKFAAYDRPIRADNNGQTVTFGTTTGPGDAAISIQRWLPITIDGNEGWIPHFGV